MTLYANRQRFGLVKQILINDLSKAVPYCTVMTLSFQIDRSGQTVLGEQSDKGLHCLLFYLHLFDEIP